MTKEHIKQDIAHLLETIAEQVEIIYSHENKIPQIELDIILSNIRNLYEQLYALNKLNSRNENIAAVEKTVTEKIPLSKFTPSEPKKIIVADESTTISPAKEKKIIEPARQESVTEQIEIAASNNIKEEQIVDITKPAIVEPVQPTIKEEPKINLQQEIAIKAAEKEDKQVTRKPSKTAASLFDAAPSLGEQFDETKTLKEKFSSTKSEKSVADKIHHQKIEDLKKAIGINEKFLFINELFEGNLASYNEHIEKINSSPEVNHARSIVDSLIAKYNWNHEQEIVKKFMDLVERRFI